MTVCDSRLDCVLVRFIGYPDLSLSKSLNYRAGQVVQAHTVFDNQHMEVASLSVLRTGCL